MNIYETDKLLGEYLLFHYGTPEEILPWPQGPREALGYPQRCVSECLDVKLLPENARALDLGCAVGRSTFELARHCTEVVGIDYSRRFVEAASVLQREVVLDYLRTDEGDLTTRLTARVPQEIDRSRVSFEAGDAMNLRPDIDSFDVVLMANLIDRLSAPQRCLAALPGLVRPGGQLLITSPYTWMEEFTPRENWLGGYLRDGGRVATREGLQSALDESFELIATKDLPFLIREHARKFQWSVAEATIWRRR
ncbi:putative 4-mercaptohistidine N1-methyltransferase [Verrucomicrobiota bacterium sgz303538]